MLDGTILASTKSREAANLIACTVGLFAERSAEMTDKDDEKMPHNDEEEETRQGVLSAIAGILKFFVRRVQLMSV